VITADSILVSASFFSHKLLSYVAELSICCKKPSTASNVKAVPRNREDDPCPSRKQKPERKCNYSYEESLPHNVTGKSGQLKHVSHRNYEFFRTCIIILHAQVLCNYFMIGGLSLSFRTVTPGSEHEWQRSWHQG